MVNFSIIGSVYGSADSFIWPVTLILVLMALVVFLRVGCDIIHPTVIFLGGVAACCALDAAVTETWDLPFHFGTAVLMIGIACAFSAGSVLATWGIPLRERIGGFEKGVSLDWRLWMGLITISLLCTYLNYREFLGLAFQVTDAGNIKDMLFPVVDAIAHGKVEFSRAYLYRFIFVKCVTYVSFLLVWRNLFCKRYWECAKWGSLILVYPVIVFFTGGRQQYLYLVIFLILSFLLAFRRGSEIGTKTKKELSIIGIGLIVFLLFFIGTGIINGKVSGWASSLQVLAHYGGTNVSAFDVYLHQQVIPETEYIGGCTLAMPWSVLRKFGLELPKYTGYLPDFIDFRFVTTNVYTAFYRYVRDYGLIGCGFVVFLLGYGYTAAYRLAQRYGWKDWMILVYAASAFPLFVMGREERFMNEVIVTQHFVLLLILVGMNWGVHHLEERRK